MKFLASVSALALITGPTFAGSLDEPTVAPAPTPVVAAPVMTSIWDGGYVGAQAGYGWGESDGADGEGAIGGLHAGYLGSSNSFVFGGEADYDTSEIDFDDDGGQIDDIGRLKLLAGYDYGRTMLYLTGGGAYANAEVDGSDNEDWGWVGGIGVKHMVTDAVSVGGELLHHQFDDFDDTGTDVELTTLTAKVSYHF